jgi:hypothetical protein
VFPLGWTGQCDFDLAYIEYGVQRQTSTSLAFFGGKEDLNDQGLKNLHLIDSEIL